MKNKTKEIENIFKEVFRASPYRIAAEKLIAAGYSSNDLWEFNKTSEGWHIPTDQTNNTLNEMRGFEITGQWSVK